MNTKYIFLDIDGTLMAAGGIIPDSTKEALFLAKRNGHKLFICTGRSKYEIYPELLHLPFDGIVGAAGAYVEIDDKVVFHRPMTESMISILIHYLEEKELAYMLELNDRLLLSKTAVSYIHEFVQYCEENHKQYDKLFFSLGTPIPTGIDITKLPINKIIFIRSPYNNEQIRQELQNDFTFVSDSIGLLANSGEISEIGMNKAQGIFKVMDYYNADIQAAVSIGDGDNDIEMLKTTGISIAMGNASDSVKAVSDYITSHVEQHGIRNAFSHYSII